MDALLSRAKLQTDEHNTHNGAVARSTHRPPAKLWETWTASGLLVSHAESWHGWRLRAALVKMLLAPTRLLLTLQRVPEVDTLLVSLAPCTDLPTPFAHLPGNHQELQSCSQALILLTLLAFVHEMEFVQLVLSVQTDAAGIQNKKPLQEVERA